MEMNHTPTAMCRVCTATRNEPLLVAFTSEDRRFGGEMDDLAEAIGTVGDISVGHNDGLPQHCCVDCLREVEAAYRVRRMCQESDRKLREMFASEVKVEEVKQEEEELGELVFKEEIEEARLEEAATEEEEEPETEQEPELQQDESNDGEEELYEVMEIVGSTDEEDESPEVGGFKCGGCKQTYETIEQLEKHVNVRGMNLSADELAVRVQCKVYFSTVEYSLKKNNDLDYNDHINAEIVCCGCSQKFNSPQELLKHCQEVHFPKRSTSSESRFRCNICYRSFASRKDQFAHKGRLYYDREKYYCTICGTGFNIFNNFKKHQELHGGDLQKCVLCPYIHTNSGNLRRHMMSHISSNGTYKCLICSQFFITSSELSDHSRSHAAPYTCPKCPRLFHSKQSLTGHIKKHI